MFIPCLTGTLKIWTYSGYRNAVFNEIFICIALFYNWSLSHKWWDLFERGKACGQDHLIGVLQDKNSVLCIDSCNKKRKLPRVILRLYEQRENQRNMNTTRGCAHATTVAVEKHAVLCILTVRLWPRLSSMQSAWAVLWCHLWPFWR